MILITCCYCNVNTFEKYLTKKYCDECNILVKRERCKKYKQNNKDKIKEYNKNYKQDHKEETKEYNKKYNVENREQIQQRQTEQHRERRKNDPSYKLILTARSRMYKLIKGIFKGGSVTETIGCDGDFLKKWLSSQFTEDMTLENHGEVWHIDHVIPCALFDLSTTENQKQCFHWTNLQPKHKDKNLEKNNSLDFKEVHLHELKLSVFIKQNNVSEKFLYNGLDRYNSYKQCCS